MVELGSDLFSMRTRKEACRQRAVHLKTLDRLEILGEDEREGRCMIGYTFVYCYCPVCSADTRHIFSRYQTNTTTIQPRLSIPSTITYAYSQTESVDEPTTTPTLHSPLQVDSISRLRAIVGRFCCYIKKKDAGVLYDGHCL